MSAQKSVARRRFLTAAAASGLLGAVERQVAWAATAPDYKALVCIFQQGGNDGENTLIRSDTKGYATYAAIRAPASGVNIPREALLPIRPSRDGTAFGFHPACAPFQAMFERRALAVVANVGMLAVPSTREALERGGTQRPANLFSHSDQQRALQSADFRGMVQTGWGGRIADRLTGHERARLPAVAALDQWGMFGNGERSIPVSIPLGASTEPAISPDPVADAIANAAMRDLVGHRRTNAFDVAAQAYALEGLSASAVITPILRTERTVSQQFLGRHASEVAKQLLNVALMIEAREQTGLRRQIFLVRQGNYDTHGSQAPSHHRLLADLSTATAGFHDAIAAMGLAGNVTTFTMSDFGRTFKPAANKGTDHGWGNYAFVMGGAVRGGDIYGVLPTQALGGPDDLGNAGRWIPTTSLEQYGATLARWFGVREEDLAYVFPNIGAFARADLGFMRKA